MSEIKSFIIRAMTEDDLDQAFDLSMAEGWNQTIWDWRLLFDNPDNICIVAEKNNRVAGTATALIHENRIAWIGMVLVDKTLRGQGAGRMLLVQIIDRLKHVESVKLDATPAGEPLYRKLGFIEEHKIFRMTCSEMNYSVGNVFGSGSSNISSNMIEEIVNLDSIIFGASRSHLLNKLFNSYPGKSFCLKKENYIDGFISGRKGSRFNYMGPLCALTETSARQLISRAIKSLNNQAIALDIPEDKTDLVNWLESIGFVKQRHFIRMYLKDNPYPGIVNNQYLISGPEFG